MLVVDLGKWMNKTLINWGIDPAVADRFDETIMALLMIVVAIVLNYLCQAILIGGMKQYTRRKPHQWNTRGCPPGQCILSKPHRSSCCKSHRGTSVAALPDNPTPDSDTV
jgi:hypothetical protein